MRVSPSFDYVCPVCGTKTVVQNLTGYRDGKVVRGYQPPQCPACDLPYKFAKPVDLGGARELLLTLYGASFQKQQFGTIDDAFARLARNEAELDAYVQLMTTIDFPAWTQQIRDVAGNKLDRHDREALKLIEQMRADPARLTRLDAAAEAARQRLRAERDRHLVIYNQRHP